jgi:hypothetical protein
MNGMKIMIEEVGSNLWYLGIEADKDKATVFFNRLVNWGCIDPLTTLNETCDRFFYFTVKPTKLFAYYVSQFAAKYAKPSHKGIKGGIARLAKYLAQHKLETLPRESFRKYIQPDNHEITKQYYRLGMQHDYMAKED